MQKVLEKNLKFTIVLKYIKSTQEIVLTALLLNLNSQQTE